MSIDFTIKIANKVILNKKQVILQTLSSSFIYFLFLVNPFSRHVQSFEIIITCMIAILANYEYLLDFVF